MNLRLSPKLNLLIISCCTLIAACVTPRRGPLKALSEAQTLIPFDAVIVPGVPYKETGWDSVMKARVLWSWILYKNGYVRNVIYSGGAVYTPYYECRIMGLYAQQLGIPAEHIYYDTAARHSTENVYYSYMVAQRAGFKSIALATDPFQSAMLRGFTRRRFASPVYHIPFVTDSLGLYNHLNPVIDPGPAAVGPGWISIFDQEGLFQRFRGTMGRDIDWKQHQNGRLGPL